MNSSRTSYVHKQTCDSITSRVPPGSGSFWNGARGGSSWGHGTVCGTTKPSRSRAWRAHASPRGGSRPRVLSSPGLLCGFVLGNTSGPVLSGRPWPLGVTAVSDSPGV